MEIVILAGAGRIVLYLVRLFAHSTEIKTVYLQKLLECDFCASFWIYFCLGIFFKLDLTQQVLGYVPFVSEVLNAMILSFTVTIFAIGWTTRFGVFQEI